ncbi:MAG: ABC transporter ATP-binding protein [Thermoleophilia bacterium]|nr:ABC transporter ATP-binding protein [Thermoleophilia bacterium]
MDTPPAPPDRAPTPPASGPPVLELRGIVKRFGALVASDHVHFDLRKGEVHALLGENGAGKSTLMNVLFGLLEPDEGEIRINGERVRITGPGDAIARGIGMVHQHFMLVPVMTVAENIVLGMEPSHAGLLDMREAVAKVRAISQRFNLRVDPEAMVEDITVGQQQRVEILKALYRGADILILDEPTAVLTPQEIDELIGIVRGLTDQGTSVVFITHKLNEILDVADRVTVLRRGQSVETVRTEGATQDSLAALMVGRDVNLSVDKTPAAPGEPVLTVTDLVVDDDRGVRAVDGVSFTVNAGEIVAIAGVDGNGQGEMIDAITGLIAPASGSIVVDGTELAGRSPADALDAGVGHIPTDRQHRGLVMPFTLAENVALHDFDKPPVGRRGILSPRAMRRMAEPLLAEFDVRGGDVNTPASSLSGGNQQKVIIAREVSRDPRVLVASQPTRGLDVGAIEYVHRRLVAERDEGRAVLLVSLELDEVLSLADRILVLFEGRIAGEFPSGADRGELGMAMLGGGDGATPDSAPRHAADGEGEENRP